MPRSSYNLQVNHHTETDGRHRLSDLSRANDGFRLVPLRRCSLLRRVLGALLLQNFNVLSGSHVGKSPAYRTKIQPLRFPDGWRCGSSGRSPHPRGEITRPILSRIGLAGLQGRKSGLSIVPYIPLSNHRYAPQGMNC
jgi:hypothetical protein